MLRRILLAGALLFALPASADWTLMSTVYVSPSASQSIIRYEWTTATDSTGYDISSCKSGVDARFDASTGDSSTDARFEFRATRNSTDTAGRGRAIAWPGPSDGVTWVGINALVEGENYLIAHPTAATTGGDFARVEIRCTGAESIRTTGASESKKDVDGDSLYEFAYLWDADGDGSTAVVCTASGAPDIACKAVGEVVYRDAADDINCAVIGCGFGKMEKTGELRIPDYVALVWPCWDAAHPLENDPAATDDNLHDQTSDAAFSDCPIDSSGKRVFVISLQGWQGTLSGGGQDSRVLERGSMSASLRRDRGSYIAVDMGPVHQDALDNSWFGDTDHKRAVSAGFNNQSPVTNVHTGGGVADGDSKGWGLVTTTGGADMDISRNGIGVCVKNTGGVVGTDYSAAGWAATLAVGDEVLIPVAASNYSSPTVAFQKVRVTAVPGTACGAGNLIVQTGGSSDYNGYPYLTQPQNAGYLVAGYQMFATRSDYDDTDVKIRNLTIMSQDSWNETGGTCNRTATGYFHLSGTTSDNDSNLYCDTSPLVGFWGGGRILLEDVTLNTWHDFALDGGSGGGLHTANRVTWVNGQGSSIADTGNGWFITHGLVDESQFVSQDVLSIFAPGLYVEDLEVRNSKLTYFASLANRNEASIFKNIRFNASVMTAAFQMACGARWNLIKDVQIFGAGGYSTSGYDTGVYFSCVTPSTPVYENVFENFVVDPPFNAQYGELNPLVMFQGTGATAPSGSDLTNLAPFTANYGNVFKGFRSIGYSGTAADEGACLFMAYDAISTSYGSSADTGESYVFNRNYFEGNSVGSTGRVFCVGTEDGRQSAISSDGGTTPVWGDPHGCGNMKGAVPYANSRCNPSELGNGTRASVDFPNLTAGTCGAAAETVTLAGLATTDSVIVGHVGDDTGQLGQLIITAYPTANTINFKACNPTAGAINATATSLWWKAVR